MIQSALASALALVVKLLPLIFAFGFLTPVLQQAIVAFRWTPPFGLSPLIFSLVVCGAWGLVAQVRGSWL
ncbi:MAG: hypothetical protein EP340_05155 [Alphaproteobacteria bacterium]|nr:MAG: hypothetical protein EP340_05155 [Alphaproteobacteria bacterium]